MPNQVEHEVAEKVDEVSSISNRRNLQRRVRPVEKALASPLVKVWVEATPESGEILASLLIVNCRVEAVGGKSFLRCLFGGRLPLVKPRKNFLKL